ncbi:hypothetical protein PR048_006437 [Dryococelus australis]|uniref:Reverse transcriptase domain-containing protein n=1 Tax=Dryococelus australis TaxID=614101 RepID=A0ABQ9IB23_9NEOP|nr:hypothetical protein PR048_006437 [Dryococelus australis]
MPFSQRHGRKHTERHAALLAARQLSALPEPTLERQAEWDRATQLRHESVSTAPDVRLQLIQPAGAANDAAGGNGTVGTFTKELITTACAIAMFCWLSHLHQAASCRTLQYGGRALLVINLEMPHSVKQLSSYIKDTGHYLEHLRNLGPILQNAYMVTIDVTSLYTNIPHSSSLFAKEHYFKQKLPHSKTSTAFLVNNQQQQLPISRHTLPLGQRHINGYTYGPNLYQSVHGQARRKHPQVTNQPNHTAKRLTHFLNNLNAHSSLKFTWSYTKTKAIFLDVELSFHNDTIHTAIHAKPTNNLHYLNFDIYHPYHAKKSQLYSLAKAKCICSTNTRAFLDKGYPRHLVHEQIQQAISNNGTQTKVNKSDISLVIPYHVDLSKFRNILYSEYKILASLPQTQDLLSKLLRLVFKRPSNLCSKMVCRKLQPTTKVNQIIIPKGSHPWNSSSCGTCAIHQPTTSFNSRLTSHTYPIQENEWPQAIAGHTNNLQDKPVAANAASHNKDFDSCYTIPGIFQFSRPTIVCHPATRFTTNSALPPYRNFPSTGHFSPLILLSLATQPLIQLQRNLQLAVIFLVLALPLRKFNTPLVALRERGQ